MANDEILFEFHGITHDHTITNDENYKTINKECKVTQTEQAKSNETKPLYSTIEILRRHPMYDCLVLVKKYYPCLNSFVLEFPEKQTSNDIQDDYIEQQSISYTCGTRALISRLVDANFGNLIGSNANNLQQQNINSTNSNNNLDCKQNNEGENEISRSASHLSIVHVPINGLLDRLQNYTANGVGVDSKVYAFAMGLKTGERILTSCSMQELEETPI